MFGKAEGRGSRVHLALLLMFAAVGAAPDAGRAAVTGDVIIDLRPFGISPDKVLFLPDNVTLLLVSNEDQRLGLFNVETRRVVANVDLRAEFGGSVEIFDIAIDPKFQHAYLVGTSSSGPGVIGRLSLSDLDLKTLTFSDAFYEASVAASAGRHIFIGDVNSSTVTAVDKYYFDEFGDSGRSLSRYDLDRNIYLKDGPAYDLGASEDGKFVVVSHAGTTQLSLVNVEYAEVVNSFGSSERGRHSVPLVVRHNVDRGWKVPMPVTAFAIADFEKDALVAAYIDTEFQSIREAENARLELRATANDDWRSPLILSASENMATIVVANRTQNRALFRGPVVARIVELRGPPRHLAVSPDGTHAAVLSSADPTLQLIGNPLEWAATSGATPGSDRVREAQTMLLALRFPVGSVDGMDGPTTQRAVRIFQESAGLVPSGTLDAVTLDRLYQVSAEATPTTASPTDDPVAQGQCELVDVGARCNSRFSSNDISSVFDGQTTEQMICAAPSGSSMPVQIDTYTLTRSSSEYKCTSYHSCPFIRYRELFAYRSICSEEAQETSRPLSPRLRAR
jgi:peptidoglycan hydrolase-like protein with peptidoglycan-binding domain